ncbi:hypothetical protein Vafri_17330 [Volvox africanus]|uniref:Uncharacterized protein n=1 Tax=Volvox africanus TaxID=51714 RepID=A0A8J4F7B2_9CHLO|nr:hypothetical protein Vafri_17330 [Volvox africanus]
MAARNALDDNVCEGEARSGPGGVAEESDTDCKIVCGGDVDCPMRPPPQKRKVLGGAYAKAAAAVAITVRAATGNAAAPKGIEPGGSLTLPSGAVARHPSSASSHPSALPRPLPSEEGLSALKGNAASRSRYWDETAAAAPAPSPGMNDSNAGAANGVAGGGGGSGSGSGRDGPGYKYSTVIRGRAERDGLQAVECAGCRYVERKNDVIR